jgi:hypothetical protein
MHSALRKCAAILRDYFTILAGTLFAVARDRFLANGHTPNGWPKVLVKKGLDRSSSLQQNARILRQERGSARIVLFPEPTLVLYSTCSLRFFVAGF